MIKSRLAVNLRDARLARGLTQQALADLIGVSGPRISEWESGRVENPHLNTLVLLARALHLSLDQLVRGPP